MTENVSWHSGAVDRNQRETNTGGRGVTVWLTGLSGSGKSTVAYALEELLVEAGRATYVLDGDNLRHGLNADLGFSADDRSENVRRVGEVARLMADAGLVVLVPVISPYAEDRAAVRVAHEDLSLPFLEVHVDAPLPVVESRDPKGLYKRARDGEIKGMTGIDDPYEAPTHPDVLLDTSVLGVDESADSIRRALQSMDERDGL